MANRPRQIAAALLLVAGSTFSASCAATLPRADRHQFTMLGWMGWSSPDMMKQPPAEPMEEDVAVLVRDAETNALSLTVSPPEDAKRLASHSVANFQFVLRFQSRHACPLIEQIVLPLDTSNQVELVNYTGGDSITLTLQGTGLGRELLLSSLLAPGGISGFVNCGGRILWLRGRAADPTSAYAAIWRRRSGQRNQVYVTSLVEYPIRLYRVEVGAGRDKRVFSGDIVVAPWRSAVFDMPAAFFSDSPLSNPLSINVQSTPQIAAPVTFQQYRGEKQ